ncbi:hypothetical protein EON63_20240 [archaeon]|nr:MAG: hypothetical protein EON63_20240 [archaeon]
MGVTGNAMDVDVQEYELAGADLILTKPMRMDALQRLLDFCEVHGRCASHWGDPNLPPVSALCLAYAYVYVRHLLDVAICPGDYSVSLKHVKRSSLVWSPAGAASKGLCVQLLASASDDPCRYPKELLLYCVFPIMACVCPAGEVGGWCRYFLLYACALLSARRGTG